MARVTKKAEKTEKYREGNRIRKKKEIKQNNKHEKEKKNMSKNGNKEGEAKIIIQEETVIEGRDRKRQRKKTKGSEYKEGVI
jgi:hypothetical protein